MGPPPETAAYVVAGRAPARAAPAVIALSGMLMIAAWTFHANRAFYHDDAYITLRYAQNLLAGQGAVWNPGERVQGFTSPLELGLVGALGWAGVDLRQASRAIGVVSLGAMVFAVFWLQWRRRRSDPADPFWAVPVALAGTCCPLIVWSLGGLETVLFCFLVAVGCLLLALERPARWMLPLSAACLGMGFLARPDGLVFAVVSAGWLVMPRRSKRLRNAIVFGVTWLTVVLPYMIWQAHYYGSIVPNTFYAKVNGLWGVRLWSGLSYVGAFALQPPYLLLVPVILLVGGLFLRVWTPPAKYLFSIVLVYCLYVVAAGGDHMPAYRLMLPIVVPLGYLAYLGLRAMVPADHRVGVLAVYAVVLAASALQIWSGALNPRAEDEAATYGRIVGKYIGEAWPAGSLVALNTAGSTPYFAPRLRFLDMLGLNDAHIARRQVDRIRLAGQGLAGHMKGDGVYVLSREPDYIIVGPAEGAPIWQPLFLSDLEISEDPRFAACYQVRQVFLDADGRRISKRRGAIPFAYYQRVGR